jgi:hypothetical protein
MGISPGDRMHPGREHRAEKSGESAGPGDVLPHWPSENEVVTRGKVAEQLLSHPVLRQLL